MDKNYVDKELKTDMSSDNFWKVIMTWKRSNDITNLGYRHIDVN